jgi:Cu/Ag efflux pump CusA
LLLDLRALLVAAVSVALSLLAAVLVLQALGYTFNALVVLGLLLASAVVVDDAVGGVLEIVERVRVRGGSNPEQSIPMAVLEACAPLRSTLGYATLFVALSVAPVFFSKGPTATFVHPMVLAFAVAVFASMVVALTFTPALAWLLFARVAPRDRAAALRNRLRAVSRKVLHGVLGLPAGFLAGVCVLGLVGVVALPFLKQPAAPAFMDRNLVVEWDGPAGASLAEMDRITQRTVHELQALPSVSDTAAILGRAVSGDQIVDVSSGQIFVTIKPRVSYGQALAAIRGIVEGTPGMRASISTYESEVLGGVLAPASRDAVVRIYGQDYDTLRGLAGQVQTLMSHVRDLGSPHVLMPTVQPNIEVSINNLAALRAGVLAGDARREASTLVSGLTVGNFFEQQAVFDVIVRGVPSVRSSIDDVRNLLLDTSGGGHVRLSQIATVGVHADPIDIQHEALSRYVDVSAPVRSGSVAAAQARVQRELGRISYPLGYHAEIPGGSPSSGTSHIALLSYVLATVVGMLLLAQAAFGSWRLAALFFLSLPVALAGGLLVALVTGQLSSLGADAGLLAVFAFAARQGMLQIAHIRRFQAEDGGPLTARIVVEAAGERLAPALAAAAVAAVVMLPFVILGNVAGNEITHVAAGVILGGLLTSVLLTQLLLPAVCLRLGPTTPITPAETLGEPVQPPDVEAPILATHREASEPIVKGDPR